MKRKFLLVAALIIAALVAIGCYKYYYIDEVTDYYELDYQPEHNYISGGMDANLDIKKRNLRGFVKSDEEAVAIMQEEFSEEMNSLASAVNDTTTLEHATKEESALVRETIREEMTLRKRWLITVKHPRKYSSDEAMDKIKDSYKDVIKKGEYDDGHFKIKVTQINPH